jgi:hypothetical protein
MQRALILPLDSSAGKEGAPGGEVAGGETPRGKLKMVKSLPAGGQLARLIT